MHVPKIKKNKKQKMLPWEENMLPL